MEFINYRTQSEQKSAELAEQILHNWLTVIWPRLNLLQHLDTKNIEKIKKKKFPASHGLSRNLDRKQFRSWKQKKTSDEMSDLSI